MGVLAGLCFALPALLYPHGNDQALHYYLGQGLLLGELPYAHGISGKPPLIFAVHAIAISLFGPHQWSIRALEALALWPAAVWIARLLQPGREARDGDVGAAAVLVYGVQYLYFDYWDLSHPETFVAIVSLWGAQQAAFNPRSRRRAWLCGMACGLAFMLKYTGAALSIPVAAYCGVRAMHEACIVGRSPIAALLQAAGMYLLGLAAVVALCVLPFIVGQALEPMWEVLYTFTLRYVEQAPGVAYTMQWTRPEAGKPLLLASGIAAAVGLLATLFRRRFTELSHPLLLLSMLAAALATVWMQKRFFSYHFTVAAPLLAAMLHWGLSRTLPRRLGLPVFGAALLVGIALRTPPEFCTDPKYNYRAHVASADRFLRGQDDRRKYLRPFVGMNYLDHYWIHEHIGLEAKKRARPGDALCARGFATSIYEVASMRCPSRHVMQAWPAGLPEWEPEWFADIETHLPRFVVTFRDRPDELRQLRRLGYTLTHRMPALYVLLERPR